LREKRANFKQKLPTKSEGKMAKFQTKIDFTSLKNRQILGKNSPTLSQISGKNSRMSMATF